ncbi:M1 family metallopeptidase [soil metagenome]
MCIFCSATLSDSPSHENNGFYHAQPITYRLDNTVIPHHYRLDMSVSADLKSFEMNECITFTLTKPSLSLDFNAIDLNIISAQVVGADVSAFCSFEYDEANQRVSFSLVDLLQPGEYKLHLIFTGAVSDAMQGFYRIPYTDADGAQRVIAASQFESTHARRVFVCIDQPGYPDQEDRSITPKAKYQVSITVPNTVVALSVGDVRSVEFLPMDRQRILFTETTPIPTYVVVFIVGDLVSKASLVYTSKLSGRDIPIRVWHTPGQEHLVWVALKGAQFALEYYETETGIPYQSDCLNLVALPNFMFGAMENHCSHTFRETALLVAEDADPVAIARVLETLFHEIAHNNYGNLATMSWWHGVTAKEMMATFCSHMAVDAYRPDLKIWDAFLVRRHMALSIDGLNATRRVVSQVGSPEEAESMYDALSYEKGCALMYMLYKYVGADNFRAACRIYLERAQYRNADLPDLWSAFDEVTGLQISELMKGWYDQPGYPLVKLSIGQNGTIEVSQELFKYIDGHKSEPIFWNVPVRVKLVSGTQARTAVLNLPKEAKGASQELAAGEFDYVMANVDFSGFYRTEYDATLYALLLSNLSRLSVAERFAVLCDSWAMVRANRLLVTDYFRLIESLKDEEDPNIWNMVLSSLKAIEGIVSEKNEFRRGVGRIVTPAFERIIWASGNSESPQAKRLRSSLVHAMGTLVDDTATQSTCRLLQQRYTANLNSIDSDLVPAVISVAAHIGDARTYEAYLRAMKTADNPQDRIRYLVGLAEFSHKQLLKRTLGLTLEGAVKPQDVATVLTSAMTNPLGAKLTWQFVKENWQTLKRVLPGSLLVRILASVSVLNSPQQANDVRSFIAENPLDGFEVPVSQALENLAISVRFRRQQQSAARGYFADK